MGVEDHRRTGGPVEQEELVVEREVVEEAEIDDQVVALERGVADVLVQPGDARVLGEPYGARIDRGDLPTGVRRPDGVEAVPSAEVDEMAGR